MKATYGDSSQHKIIIRLVFIIFICLGKQIRTIFLFLFIALSLLTVDLSGQTIKTVIPI